MHNRFRTQLNAANTLLACLLASLSTLPLAAKAQVLGPPGAPPAAGLARMAPPAIDVDKTLAPLGLTPRGTVYAKKKHREVMATTTEGRAVVVAFDWAGRVKSVTDADHRRGGVAGVALPTNVQVTETVRNAGFDPLGVVDVKRHHVVMRAKNRQGEMLDLHVDFAGTIYKQVWLR